MHIRWTLPAARALENVIDYIAKENPQAAFQVAQRIRIAVRQLAEHPKLGRAGRVRGTYELVIHGIPYIVPYRIRRNEIQVELLSDLVYELN
jgi:toxin ParE1/3/4